MRGASGRDQLVLTTGLGMLLAACSVVTDADRVQCHTEADCRARGAAFATSACVDSICQADPAWACLSMPVLPSTQAPPYRVNLTVRDLVTQMPASNARVDLCRKIDVDCTTPVDSATTDGGGAATFSVPMSNFSGYVQVRAAGDLTTLYFFNPGIDRDQTLPPISVATPAANMGLLLQLGRTPIAGRGNVAVSATDCTGAPAAGIKFSTTSGDGMTSAFYAVAGLPSSTATQTDATGYGGLINVPAGAATLSAKLTDPDADLGAISILVRDETITYSHVVPFGH